MKPKKKIKDINLDEKLNEENSKILFGEFNKKINDEYNKFTKNLNYNFNILAMQDKIIKHKNDILCPPLNIKKNNISINSWFTINQSEIQNFNFKSSKYKTIETKDIKYKCKKIILKLTNEQKKIINEWLNTYAKMYNISIDYIKNNIKDNKKVLNFIYLRSMLYNEKTLLTKKSSIKVHDLDSAIKLACTNYKSALTNYRNGNIKNFRLRSWNKEKDCKILDLEKSNFSNGTIRKKILGTVKGYYDGKKFNFDNVDCDSKILKNKLGEYILLVPELLKDYKKKEMNDIIVSDLGVRTFSTCITKNKTIEIGLNVQSIITKYLKKKDKIMNNNKIDKNIRKKNEKIINKKISNYVDELHWKTINLMTNVADTIIIGDIHSKNIVEQKMSKITKRIILLLKFDKFKQRLNYKCAYKKKELSMQNEWMTSKMCSLCGCINEKLGTKKKFDCNDCKISIDRDINGARNIYIASIA